MIKKIEVLSRAKMAKKSHQAKAHAADPAWYEGVKLAAVCIHDVAKPPVFLQASSRLLYRDVLSLCFDDTTLEEHDGFPMSGWEARQAAGHILDVHYRPEPYCLFISCEEGISRSAGMAEAAMEALGLPEEAAAFGPDRRPNPHVKKLCAEALHELILERM